MDMENKVLYNEKWIYWFLGFTDAEGNFQIYPKKRILASGVLARYNVGSGFHLSLHNKDLELIKDIQIKLGIGKIYVYNNKPDARLAINKKSDLIYLIDNTFDKYSLITKHQKTRYLLFRDIIKNNIKEFETLEQFNEYKSKTLEFITTQVESKDNVINLEKIENWIIGFINGEGCFYIKNNKCQFIIEHTDKQALEIIKNKLYFNPNVLERSARNRDIGKIRKTIYQLAISSKKDINNLIMLLDNENNIPLQGNKYIQYVEWKQHLNK